MVVNCIHNRFKHKDYIETLQAMEILLLKALPVEDFGHEFQQISLLFSSDLDKVKIETQLKTLIHIFDEKQIGTKDAIKIISSTNTSPKLLVSEVKLILLVLATDIVSERSCSTLSRIKTYR